MKVIVLGGGVIGLTSAWYLNQRGHDVTVIDRQSQCGKETSFANAGQISYGYSSPWAAPGIPLKAIQWLMQEHAPLKVKPSLSPEMIAWASKMLANCSHQNYKINKARMLRLANYSQTCLTQLRNETDIQYQGRQLGTLQVFRNAKQLESIKKDIALLQQSNTDYSLLDVGGCISREPALERVKDKLVGGLHLPNDETGDCYLFCQQLTELAKAAGVKFMFATDVQALELSHGKIQSVKTSTGQLTADHYVVACGSYSTKLLAPLGIHLPTYPVKGYSLTLPISNQELAPRSTVMDETYKVAITRFDDRLRIAGTAELAGFNLAIPEKRTATIDLVVNDLFPEVGDFSQADYWTGLRPMTPDGTPIIGKTAIKNLFTNTGHGTLGWTMACGSGKLLADIVSTVPPEVEHEDLGIQRYAR
ncbi:D-amino acid dehydrogenase [Vibrio sp. T187]|uniref:D-amino acid dehydrogenase n=1 Tax=Vibrio TaxID=662 RepID=UPI0010C99F1C|nr:MULTISPECIES: D-amino acid dehydrogenase [Vibrio]MBW3697952.1 D-amino acid dehydrogenase [Vibrio sp. T187]